MAKRLLSPALSSVPNGGEGDGGPGANGMIFRLMMETRCSYAFGRFSYGFANHPDGLPDHADVSETLSYVLPKLSYVFARLSYVSENHSYGVQEVFQYVGDPTPPVGPAPPAVGMSRKAEGMIFRYVGIDSQGALSIGIHLLPSAGGFRSPNPSAARASEPTPWGLS